jgi:hypothetical protein
MYTKTSLEPTSPVTLLKGVDTDTQTHILIINISVCVIYVNGKSEEHSHK